MKKFSLLSLFSFILLISTSAFSQTNEQALEVIIKDFETAIANKDKEKFLSLFVEQPVSWVGVYTKRDYENELKWAKSEEGKKLKRQIGDKFREPAKFRHSTPEIFIESITDNTKHPREEITNVKILTNGEVATVYFDYIFFDDDKRINSGKENWQLINTGKGWKINAVNFSISRG